MLTVAAKSGSSSILVRPSVSSPDPKSSNPVLRALQAIEAPMRPVGEGYNRRLDPGYGEIPVEHGQIVVDYGDFSKSGDMTSQKIRAWVNLDIAIE